MLERNQKRRYTWTMSGCHFRIETIDLSWPFRKVINDHYRLSAQWMRYETVWLSSVFMRSMTIGCVINGRRIVQLKLKWNSIMFTGILVGRWFVVDWNSWPRQMIGGACLTKTFINYFSYQGQTGKEGIIELIFFIVSLSALTRKRYEVRHKIFFQII